MLLLNYRGEDIMHIEAALKQVQIIKAQRSILLLCSGGLMLCCILMSFYLMRQEARIILVPGLNQEVWTSDGRVSRSYVEEASLMYIPLLLDLDQGSRGWKRDRLLQYVSKAERHYMEDLASYFARAGKTARELNVRTHFAVKKIAVDEEHLTATISGQMMRFFGDEGGPENQNERYQLLFEWLGGRLLIKSFVKLQEER